MIAKVLKLVIERNDKTNGEFIGIFKINKKVCNIFLEEYNKLKTTKKTNKLQIHDFFRYLIKKNINIEPTYIKGEYMEIDTYNDFKLAKEMFYEK